MLEARSLSSSRESMLLAGLEAVLFSLSRVYPLRVVRNTMSNRSQIGREKERDKDCTQGRRGMLANSFEIKYWKYLKAREWNLKFSTFTFFPRISPSLENLFAGTKGERMNY